MLYEVLKPFRHNAKMRHPGEFFDGGRFETDGLVRNGLVRVVATAPTPTNQMRPDPAAKADAGKSQAGGQAPQSSASHPAQVSTDPTVTTSAPGGQRETLTLPRRRRGASL